MKKFTLFIKLDFLPVRIVVLFGLTDVKLKINEAVQLTYVRSLTIHSFLLCLVQRNFILINNEVNVFLLTMKIENIQIRIAEKSTKT
jgi:hypothetical protein